jgi:hypothetical protein
VFRARLRSRRCFQLPHAQLARLPRVTRVAVAGTPCSRSSRRRFSIAGLRPRQSVQSLGCLAAGRALLSALMAFVAHLVHSYRVWPNPALNRTGRCASSLRSPSARPAG